MSFFRTHDGGVTWANLGVPVAVGNQPYRVHFVDREVGWLDSASVMPVAYKSVDGGVTWRAVSLPAPSGGWPARGEFFVAAQPTRGVGVVATVVSLAPYASRSRAGEQVVSYPPLTIRSFDGGVPVWYSYSIFANATPGGDLRLLATQAPHQVQLGSLDSGATWSVISPPNGSGAVGYSDAQTWWWIGSGAWSTSSDGGSTWTPTRHLGVIEPLPGSLQVLDSQTAWFGVMAGGTRALLERTADAGLHWGDDRPAADSSHKDVASPRWPPSPRTACRLRQRSHPSLLQVPELHAMSGGRGVASSGTTCTIAGTAAGTVRGRGAAECGRGSGELPWF